MVVVHNIPLTLCRCQLEEGNDTLQQPTSSVYPERMFVFPSELSVPFATSTMGLCDNTRNEDPSSTAWQTSLSIGELVVI